MLKQLYDEQNVTFTENGAKAFRSTGNACLDLFSVVGALRKADEDSIIKLFIKAYAENKDIAMKILFYARDVRGGLGERRVFRILLRFAADYYSESVVKNLSRIPKYGRYDDCLELLGTNCESYLAAFVKAQFLSDLENMRDGKSVSLLAKWLPSVNAASKKTKNAAKKMAKLLCMSEKQYRQSLSALRKTIDILETRLCAGDYGFSYPNLPSKALFKYRKAFMRNDVVRYETFLKEVSEGKQKMNASCIYPYEIVQKCLDHLQEPERRALDVTWNALPDYTGDDNAIAVVDGSGSMYWGDESPNGTFLCPISVAMSLGIYFAEHNKGEFHNRFITFSQNPQLVKIKGNDIYEKVQNCMAYDDVSNTDLYKVFMLLLKTAVKHNVPQEELPKTVYIISDMEFDEGVDEDLTVFQNAKEKFEEYGYHLPNVVYWNVDSRHKQYPVEMNENGVALVSGCSSAVFSMAMNESMTPESFMLKTLNSERYRNIVA